MEQVTDSGGRQREREREEDGGNEEPEAYEANLLANAGVCV